MAARTKGFARKLAAERLAESLGVGTSAQTAPVKAVPLRIAPVIAPHRHRGLYALRVERVPQLARLSRGRNNGNGSWSLLLDEIDGIEYIGPDSAMERPALGIRLLDEDGGTLAVLELQVEAGIAEDLAPEAVDPDYLRRLSDELESARNALAERERELTDLRRAPRADSEEMQRRFATADAAAQAAAAQAKKLWEDDERSRFAAAEARWRESSDRALAQVQAKGAAALADAQARAAAALADVERGWKDRLAAAEAKARDGAAAAGGDKTRDADAARLRTQIAGIEATLKRRDEDFALLRREAAAAQQRGKDDFAAAEKSWKDAEARRLAASEQQWQAKAAAELQRVSARAESAERALTDGQKSQASRDSSELRVLREERAALQAKLAESDRAVAAARDAHAARDTELRALRDERTALQARLATAAAAPTGIPADAVDRQIESALSSARAAWETEANARLAQAEAVSRAQLAAAEARIRAEVPPPSPTPAGLAPETVQGQIDVAIAAAKAAWKTEEAARSAHAEEKWRTDSATALARLTKRAEAAETALADAKAAPPPMVVAPPPAPIDQGLIDNLHYEIEELRQALSDREVEVAQLKLTLEARRLTPETKPKFYPVQQEPEREARLHDPRRSTSKLLKEVLFVFGAIAVLFLGFPFVVPYLPYEMQDSIAQVQASVFGTVPAGYSAGPAKPAPVTVAKTGTTGAVARAVNVRTTASAGAAVVTRLKKGDAVTVLETKGNWSHIKTPNFEGWVFSSYLKK